MAPQSRTGLRPQTGETGAGHNRSLGRKKMMPQKREMQNQRILGRKKGGRPPTPATSVPCAAKNHNMMAAVAGGSETRGETRGKAIAAAVAGGSDGKQRVEAERTAVAGVAKKACRSPCKRV